MVLMRLKGVKRVTVKKGGKTYTYYRHRATGERIKGEFGTAEFHASYAALEAKKPKEPVPGSLGTLIAAYRKIEFDTDRLAARTKADYVKVFDYLAPIGDMPLHEITSASIVDFRDRAYKKRGRRFANYVVQVIRLVLDWGRERDHLESNPGLGVKTIRRPKGMPKANRAWTDTEREAVLAAATPELACMIGLGMFAALREGDACRLAKSAYDGGIITAIASKNGEALWIPVHFRLREIIAKAQATEKERARKRKVVTLDTPTLAVNRWGQPWTQNGFRASFFKLLRRLATSQTIRPGLTFHGLRHTVGKLIIEAGGTAKDVGAILGDRSAAMSELYSQEYERGERIAATVTRLEQTERAKMDKRADKVDKLG